MAVAQLDPAIRHPILVRAIIRDEVSLIGARDTIAIKDPMNVVIRVPDGRMQTTKRITKGSVTIKCPVVLCESIIPDNLLPRCNGKVSVDFIASVPSRSRDPSGNTLEMSLVKVLRESHML